MTEKNQTELKDSELLLALAAEITAAYVGNNQIASVDLPDLMRTVYRGLQSINQAGTSKLVRPEPAVAIKKSVFPDYIICLEDGKKLKMLKRHLKTSYKMTPEQYRERWNLPTDYPMVAPNYARQRSKLAKQIGLGTSRPAASKAKAA